MTRRGWLLFGAMGVIWGIPYLLIKVAVAELDPTTLVLVRTLIGASLLVPLALFRNNIGPLWKYWRWVLLYTVIEVAAPWFLLSDAERRLTSSLTGLLLAAVPLVGAVVVLVAGGDDRLDRRRVVGLAVGFVGVAALVGLDVAARDFFAVAEVAIVTVCYAVGPLIIARRLSEVPAVGVVAASLGLTAVFYVVPGALHAPHALPSTAVIVCLAILGIVCTALAFLVFFALIAEVGPARATVITYVNPAVALALGVTILGEALTIGAGLGLVLIIAGSVLGTRRSVAAAPA